MARKKRSSPASMVKTVAAQLRADALRTREGELMASEMDLIARYGVSRPTLRQAASIVQQEQLLKVKRGVNGGYLATRPAGEAVAHMAAIYLQARKVTLGEILGAVGPIRAELARLAAMNADASARQRLATFLDNESSMADGPYRMFLRSEREFGAILGEASGNGVLALFLQMIYDLAATISADADVYVGHAARVLEYRKVRSALVQAVLSGDADMAVLFAKRGGSLVARWAEEDRRAHGVAPRLGVKRAKNGRGSLRQRA